MMENMGSASCNWGDEDELVTGGHRAVPVRKLAVFRDAEMIGGERQAMAKAQFLIEPGGGAGESLDGLRG
jgi:hypothetical protein